MLNRKSIVLSDVKHDSQKKAVLTLQEDDLGVCGTLRLYNFPRELDGICSLGIYQDGKVAKAGLTLKSHMLYEFFINLKSIPKKFSAAIINFQNAVPSPILYGSSEGGSDEIYANIISELAENQRADHAKQVLDEFDVDFDEKEKQEIEKTIDKSLCEDDCSKCANCVYKKFFFENHKKQDDEVGEHNENLQSLSTKAQQTQGRESFVLQSDEKQREEENFEKTDDKQNVEKEPIFFDRLKPQIDKLFATHPIENNLQSLIPSSKWVKVEYEDDGDFFVFGLLYDDENNIKYVCYGVPAVFDEEPPKELAGFPIWLPLDQEKGFGYWLTYQDATTGEPVKAVID